MKPEELNVLIACEESQRTCIEFRNRGFNAYSCDVVKCSGNHPEWHILDNALSVLRGGSMKLQNGKWVEIDHWDLIIAHPPCTYLSNAAVGMHSLNKTPENRIEGRTLERINAMRFFMDMVMAPAAHVAVENPVGIMNTAFRKPDQVVEPYQFAEGVSDCENYVTKKTCLWLRDLPLLKINELPRPNNREIYGATSTGHPLSFTDKHGKLPKAQTATSSVRDQVLRSKTFPGMAKAFAEQWGNYLLYGEEQLSLDI